MSLCFMPKASGPRRKLREPIELLLSFFERIERLHLM